VLTAATLGLFTYGMYSIVWPLMDLLRGARLELWAELGLMLFGLLLALSAAFVRVRLPGGIALALGAMLGLQALAVHNAVHLASGLTPRIGRAVLACALIALARAGHEPSAG
jgi:fatty acid desaturase